MQIAGLDLAKYVFEIHGVDAHGKTVLRKTPRRHAVSTFFANLPPCLVGMEASNGAHFWARTLLDLGHDIRLISPQFVTPYVKSKRTIGMTPRRSARQLAHPTCASCPSSPPNS
jgi:transposase